MIFAFLIDNRRWLGAGALLAFLSSFGQTFFISIFAGEIRAAFGLSHGAWGTIYALGTTASAGVMLWAGTLTDRFRTRALGVYILGGLACACLAMAVNPWAGLLPVVVFGLRLLGQGMTMHMATVSMSRWFQATRGRALSVAGLGIALGEALLPLSFVALMTVMDWRWLWVLCAGMTLAAIPLLRALLETERTPQSLAAEAQSLGMSARHWSRRDVLRGGLFWCLVPMMLGPGAFNTAFFFHQVHFAEVKGVDHLALVALFPIYTACGVAGMVLSGALIDRLGTARLMPWFLLPFALGFAGFAAAQSLFGIALALMVTALGAGANSTLPNAFWAEFYGTAHLGAIKALTVAVMVLGSALGPAITGVGIDFGIGIERQYLAVAVYFLAASALMALGVGRARRLLQPA